MDKIWIYTIRPTWSLIINFGLCLLYAHNLPAAWRERRCLKATVRTLADVRAELKKAEYKPDSFKDWVPWLLTFLLRGRVDDCDGLAIFGRFLFRCTGLASEIVRLRGVIDGVGVGHTVCVTKDRRWMISNCRLIRLPRKKDWRTEVLGRFGGRYDRIL